MNLFKILAPFLKELFQTNHQNITINRDVLKIIKLLLLVIVLNQIYIILQILY